VTKLYRLQHIVAETLTYRPNQTYPNPVARGLNPAASVCSGANASFGLAVLAIGNFSLP